MIQIIKFNFSSPARQEECCARSVEHVVGREGSNLIQGYHPQALAPFFYSPVDESDLFSTNNNGRLTIFRRVSITVREEFRLLHIPAGFLCLAEKLLIEMNGCRLQSNGVDPGCCR